MGAFVFQLDTEVASEAGRSGGSFGTVETGIYKAKIVTATLGETKSGNNKIDLSLDLDGHDLTIYQAFVLDEKWASGSDNFGYKDWQAFAVVSGMTGCTTFPKPLMKDDNTPVMKDGQPVILNAIKELDGVELKLAIVKVYDVYGGKVTEKNEVFASFTLDGLNANEKTNGLAPTTMAKLEGRLADKKTNKYKAHIENGGLPNASDYEGGTKSEPVAEAPVSTADLGLD